ncbi:RND family transporter, partial [Aromatoleum toluclasticum]|nr:RND family transporter [Aromatoleum toluclasticum]
MAVAHDSHDRAPVVRSLADFDQKSGNALERLIFNHRLAVMVMCALVTVVLALVAAAKLHLNASFESMLPQSQPYIQNYLDNRNELRGLGNVLRVVVA